MKPIKLCLLLAFLASLIGAIGLAFDGAGLVRAFEAPMLAQLPAKSAAIERDLLPTVVFSPLFGSSVALGAIAIALLARRRGATVAGRVLGAGAGVALAVAGLSLIGGATSLMSGFETVADLPGAPTEEQLAPFTGPAARSIGIAHLILLAVPFLMLGAGLAGFGPRGPMRGSRRGAIAWLTVLPGAVAFAATIALTAATAAEIDAEIVHESPSPRVIAECIRELMYLLLGGGVGLLAAGLAAGGAAMIQAGPEEASG